MAQRLSARLLIAALAFPFLPAFADDSDAISSQEIDILVVLGSRTPVTPGELPGAAQLLSAQDLRDAESPFLTDLLRTLPTTAMSRSGGPGSLTQMRIRGSESDHVQVRIDGFKVNDPAIGSAYDFAHVRGPTVEAVELLPGPSGALWGSDAVAGALHLRTPRLDGLELRAGAGSRRTREVTLGAGATGDRGHVTAIADHYDTRGENVSADGGEPDGYTVTTLNLNGGVDLTPQLRLTGTVRGFDASVEFDPTPAPDFVPADGDRESDIRRVVSGMHLHWTPSEDWQHRLTLEALGSRHKDFADGVATDARLGRRYRGSIQSAYAYEAVLPGSQQLVVALEAERERFIQRGVASAFGDPNQRQSLRHHSGLLEWRAHPHESLHVTAALRQDWNSDFSDATTWRSGLRSALPAALGDAWITFATAVKNPAFTERFGFTPDSFLGNPGLEPERSRGLEIGWVRGFMDDRAELELLWHRARLHKEIDGFVFDFETGLFTARNRDRNSRREGVEARLTLRPDAATTITARYAWLDASEPHGNGGQVRELRRPRHSGAVSLTRAVADDRLRLRTDVIVSGKRDDLSFATFPATRVALDDYILINAAASWQASAQVELFLRADNLADEDYEDVFGFNTPGRQFHIGFRLRP
ncbi:MAG: TonB-dependent receptor [Gammaproteobacteria bacterium]|nr:MAG: TonB-dependent receptor [Gammaproteobacteria bacterium]